LAILLAPTGLARAYRGEQIGWTRFWIFIGIYAASVLLFWIPLLNILVILALIAAYVWGAVDVFQLYKTRTDAEGGALVSSPRDDKFAHAFYIFFIVSLIVSGVALVLGLVLGAILVSIIMNAANNPNSNGYNSNPYLQNFENQYR